MPDSIIASLPGRVHDIVGRAVNQADVHWCTADGRALVFIYGAIICREGGGWHMIDPKQCLVSLDRKRDGRFFLAGHGRD